MKNIIVFVLATLLSFNLYAKDLCKEITKEEFFEYTKNASKGLGMPSKPMDYYSRSIDLTNDGLLKDQESKLFLMYQFTNIKLVQNIPNEGALVRLHQYSDQMYFIKNLQGIDNSTIKLLSVTPDGSYNYNSLMGVKTILAFKQITNKAALQRFNTGKKGVAKACGLEAWKAEYDQANSKN